MIRAIRVPVVCAVATQIRAAAAFEHVSRAMFARKARFLSPLLFPIARHVFQESTICQREPG